MREVLSKSDSRGMITQISLSYWKIVMHAFEG